MAVALSPNAKQQFFTDGSTVAAGYKLHTYAAGTTTPLATYSDRAGTVENLNPITLDARGEAVIYLTPGLVYDYALKTDTGATVWTRPGVVSDTTPGAVFASQRGLKGDASDETTKLQSLLDSADGRIVYLEANKVYGFDGVTGLVIPSNTTLVTNGSTFKKRTSNTGISVYGITVGDHCEIDRLALEIPGASNETGIKIAGSNVNIGRVEVSSLINDAGSGSPVNGLYVHSDTGTVEDVSIGSVRITGHAQPVRYHNVDGLQVGFTRIDNYKTGVYLIDCKNVLLNGARIVGLSPSATGGAGNNGWLLQTDSTLASRNIVVIGYHVEDSAEHAFRIGSDRQCDNVKFIGCSSRNTGAIAGVSTGGAAVKVLCGNTTSEFHTNISVLGFCAEDCSNSTAGLDNMAAFQIGKVKGGQWANCTIRKKNNTYSCKFGFQVFASEDIEINNPNITDCMRHSFQFIQAGVVSPPYPTTMSRVHVNGGFGQGMETANSSAVARFTVGDGTFTDVSIKGTTLSGGGAACLHDTPTGAGSYVECEVDATYRNPLNVAGGPPFNNNNSILLTVRSPFYGTFNPNAANASLFQDVTNGLVKIRKAGAWTTL